MLCSNYGSNISFGGNVCPHCRHDKSEDQNNYALMLLAIPAALLGAVVGGWIGFHFGTGFLGTIKSLLTGVVLGSLAGLPVLIIGMVRLNNLVQRRREEMEAARQRTQRQRGDAW
jgi:hypothetical protein